MTKLGRKHKRTILTLTQFITAALAFVLVVYSVMTYLVANNLFANSIESAKASNTETARQIADSLEKDFDNAIRMLSLTQNSLSKLNLNLETADKSARNIVVPLLELTTYIHRAWFVFEKGIRYNDEYYIAEYINKKGEIMEYDSIRRNGNIDDPQSEKWYTEPMATNRIYIQSSSIDDFDNVGMGAYSAIISVPILANGKAIGVCCADVLYADMLDQLYDLHVKQGRVIFLLNQDLMIINAHDPQYIGKNIAEYDLKEKETIREKVKEGQAYSAEVFSPFLLERVFMHLQPISFHVGSQQLILYLHIGTPLRVLYYDADKSLMILVAGNFVSMLFITLMIYWGSHKIIQPIRILARKAQRVAAGDFEADIFDLPENELRGNSETATLQRAFNEMLHVLQENLLTVENRVEERTLELKTLNNYITLLMNSTTSFSLLLDREWKIIYLTESLRRLMGIPNYEKLAGMCYSDVLKTMFPDERFVAAAFGRLTRAMAGEEFVEDGTVCWPTGNRIIYRISYKQMKGENGEFTGVILAAQDITALRFEEADRRLNDMLHSTSLPCVVWDENGDVIAYNKETVEFFGITPNLSIEEFEREYFSIQPEFQPDGRLTRDLRQADLSEALKNGFAQDTVYLSKPDGTSLYVRVIFNRISGVFSHMLLTYYHDMTDVVRKEEEAKTAEERMRLMLDSTPMMCVLRDDRGKVIDCNQEAMNLLGASNKTDLCDNFYSYLPETQPDGTKGTETTEINMKLADENGFSVFERSFKTESGEMLPVETKIVRIPWKDTYWHLTFSRDLRETKANEQRIRESAAREREAEVKREAAQAASDAKSQFLANMSHEIRTPMNAVLGMSELLLQENLSMRQRRYVQDIKTSATALLDIINDILDVSKIQAGKLNLVPVNFDFAALLDNISSMAHFLVEGKNIAFRMDMHSDAPKYLYGDDVRLRQVLLNLLSNAVKFTHEGYVRLVINVTDTSICVTVSDTGMGIRPDDISRLFDAFEQVDTMKNRGKRGTGLGLSITKGLVEMMGGRITVESVYGQGTSFNVEIPKVLGDASLISHYDSDEISIYAPDAKLLVVDDNVINLNVANGLLRLCSITPDMATSGKEAIEMVMRNDYDIVFMDYRMPEMSGTEATKALRSLGMKIPIIALTASAVTGTKEAMIESGMDDFLTKPILKTELKNILKKWVPPEKLLDPPPELPVEDSEDDEYDEASREFWDRIEHIGEISVVTGLSRVEGQRDVYKKTLQLMMSDIDKSELNLKAFLAAQDMHNFRIEVHGIKGSLSNMGAMELSAKAFEMETASGKGDVAFCAVNLPTLLEGLQRLKAKLQDAFSAILPASGPIVIPPELPSIFVNLKEAFDEFDLVRTDEELTNLSALPLAGPLRDEIDKLKDEIMKMDYTKATDHMAQLLK